VFREKIESQIILTPQRNSNVKEKTSVNVHYKSSIVHSTPKSILRRPRSERKKSKVSTQTPSKFKKDNSKLYHVNILTPGKINKWNEKFDPNSVLKTTAATKKSNIQRDAN